MTNEFKLTDETNTILIKILKSLLIAIIGYACIVYFNDLSTVQLYLLFSLGLICLIVLLSLKSYNVIGKVRIDKDKIVIDSNKVTIDLPINAILGIVFKIRGRKGTSYMPSLFQPIGVNMTNGIGNIIEIETRDKVYKLDILLQNSFDTNSLEFQIDRLTGLGLKVDKVKLPRIIGDFT